MRFLYTDVFVEVCECSHWTYTYILDLRLSTLNLVSAHDNGNSFVESIPLEFLGHPTSDSPLGHARSRLNDTYQQWLSSSSDQRAAIR